MEEKDRKRRIGNNIQQFFSGFDLNWFICFGTLLHYIRGELKISQDIDIGVIGSDIETFYPRIEGGYRIDHYLKSDTTGKLLNLCYHDEQNDVMIDIYKWVKFKGMYWHTYDVLADSDKGIPSKYIFKGMPKDVFEVEPKQVKRFQQDTRYGRVISKYGTWLRPLPEMPEEGIVLPCPHYYGYFLDIAYPDWATTREDFGVSDAIAVHKTKTCGDLC